MSNFENRNNVPANANYGNTRFDSSPLHMLMWVQSLRENFVQAPVTRNYPGTSPDATLS